ncbi:hypothetical protein HWV62_33489 [Athelia sp. TMB]|nr:hypothetical protein HWV62_33489 [Athelia sp. TMB]
MIICDWRLCVEIPIAGGRIFETGDEEFLRLGLKGSAITSTERPERADCPTTAVPIVVVFTKFDNLVNKEDDEISEMEDAMKSSGQLEHDGGMELKDIRLLALKRANDSFEMLCGGSVGRVLQRLNEHRKEGEQIRHDIPYTKVSVNKQYRNTLAELVEITQGLLLDAGDVWIVSAMAQRASAQAKIDSSIKVGMMKYWQGIAASTNFPGFKLETCLHTIHSDITSGWNFNDPDNLLNGAEFRKRILTLAQYVAPEPEEVSSWFNQSLDGASKLLGITSFITTAIVPVAAALSLSAVFIAWIAGVYKQTPQVLRCLMGHIIDLTLVMDLLFLQILPDKPPRRLTPQHIDNALEAYKATHAQEVHRQIREYADTSSFAKVLAANNAQDQIETLIRQYRSG